MAKRGRFMGFTQDEHGKGGHSFAAPTMTAAQQAETDRQIAAIEAARIEAGRVNFGGDGINGDIANLGLNAGATGIEPQYSGQRGISSEVVLPQPTTTRPSEEDFSDVSAAGGGMGFVIDNLVSDPHSMKPVVPSSIIPTQTGMRYVDMARGRTTPSSTGSRIGTGSRSIVSGEAGSYQSGDPRVSRTGSLFGEDMSMLNVFGVSDTPTPSVIKPRTMIGPEGKPTKGAFGGVVETFVPQPEAEAVAEPERTGRGYFGAFQPWGFGSAMPDVYRPQATYVKPPVVERVRTDTYYSGVPSGRRTTITGGVVSSSALGSEGRLLTEAEKRRQIRLQEQIDKATTEPKRTTFRSSEYFGGLNLDHW